MNIQKNKNRNLFFQILCHAEKVSDFQDQILCKKYYLHFLSKLFSKKTLENSRKRKKNPFSGGVQIRIFIFSERFFKNLSKLKSLEKTLCAHGVEIEKREISLRKTLFFTKKIQVHTTFVLFILFLSYYRAQWCSYVYAS